MMLYFSLDESKVHINTGRQSIQCDQLEGMTTSFPNWFYMPGALPYVREQSVCLLEEGGCEASSLVVRWLPLADNHFCSRTQIPPLSLYHLLHFEEIPVHLPQVPWYISNLALLLLPPVCLRFKIS